jgi:hypothetical protein
MDEYVIVRYQSGRRVFVDGEEAGRTNEPLTVERGTHKIDLGTPAKLRSFISSCSSCEHESCRSFGGDICESISHLGCAESLRLVWCVEPCSSPGVRTCLLI